MSPISVYNYSGQHNFLWGLEQTKAEPKTNIMLIHKYIYIYIYIAETYANV